MLLWELWEKSVGKAEMDDQIRITLLANAGLLIEYHGTTFLLDAIYGSEAHPFSALPAGCWDKMLRGLSPFDKIDYLLFTHLHPDHFSPEMTLGYLKKLPVKGIFFPEDDAPELHDLREYIKAKQIPCVAPGRQSRSVKCRVALDVTVQAFCTAHLDRKYKTVPHICYLLSFHDKHILFTADVDYVHETLSFAADIPLRAVFLNPLFFHALQRNQFFQGSLNTEALCVYHIPFPENDATGTRSVLERDLRIRPPKPWQAVALCEPYQQILL